MSFSIGSYIQSKQISVKRKFQSVTMEGLMLLGENIEMGTRVKTIASDDQFPRHYIRQWRKDRGLTIEQLADKIDVATSTISQLERGKQGYSQPTLEALAKFFECEPADLLLRAPDDQSLRWKLYEMTAQLEDMQLQQVKSLIEAMIATKAS